MLGAPFNNSEHLRCKFLCLVAECRQTFNSFMVGAESAENNGSTCLLMYDWAFFMTLSFSFWNLDKSFENAECPASRMSF